MSGLFKGALVVCVIFQLVHADVQTIDIPNGLLLKTEYGDFKVEEPVIIELIKCPAMQRLKEIEQYGVDCFARHGTYFKRYEHSIGVFVLLRKFGADMPEQIAGLLHDVSHTVFSHVGDVLFKKYFDQYAYQDQVHEWFLSHSKIKVTAILEKYAYENCCSEKAKKCQKMLEQDRPDLCMDRIEYLCRGGLAENLITQADVDAIIADLQFINNIWFFRSPDLAKKLADVAITLSDTIFGSAWDGFINEHAAAAMQRAIDLHILTYDDINFSTDQVVWNQLKSSGDEHILQCLDKIEHASNYFVECGVDECDQHIRIKFLSINPLVKTEDGLKRLTELNAEFAARYAWAAETVRAGRYIKFIK